MDVVSMGSLRADGLVWQPRPGVFVLTVACKATFRLQPGVSPLAEVQDDIAARDVCFDGDETASVYAPSDLAPYKRVADVVLVGSAFAPGGKPVRELVATLEVGEVQKSIAVHADRAFTYDGRLVEGPAFTRASLRWERAAGGGDSANPVGMSFDAPADASGRIAIPNLQPPWQSIAWPGDRFDSIGFGPIAPWWPARAWQLHRHLAGWSHERWADRPLPPDIDPRYFNAAPADQQVDALLPDTRLLLENLHPDHARLVTNLAAVRPRAEAARPGRAPETIELSPDTLWIDTDRAVATLTFRGSTPLARADEAGRVVITSDADPLPKKRLRAATLDASTVAGLLGSPLPFVGAAPAVDRAALPFVPAKNGGDAQRVQSFAGLPFQGAGAAAARLTTPFDHVEEIEPEPESDDDVDPPTVPPSPAQAPSGAPAPAKWGDETTATIDVDRLRREREALPFAAQPAQAAPARVETLPPPRGTMPPPARGTIPPPAASGGDALPAFWQRSESVPAVAPDEEDGPEIETLRPPQPAEVPELRMPALPRLASFGEVEAPPPVLPFAPAAAPPIVPPVPSLSTSAVLPFAPPVEAPRPAPPKPPPPEPKPIAVETYAAAKAAFWQPDGDARAALDGALTALGIDEDAYRAGEEKLLEALAAEAREGKATLARALRAALKAAVRDTEAARDR